MSSTKPLSGLVVVEIGHSIAAPYAGMILGELGAEVIKVENPKGGDACRGWGPPFLDGAATCFHAVNRAKTGITIDLAVSFGCARSAAAPEGPINNRHGCHRRKFAMRASPSRWLFSGWNCVPA